MNLQELFMLLESSDNIKGKYIVETSKYSQYAFIHEITSENVEDKVYIKYVQFNKNGEIVFPTLSGEGKLNVKSKFRISNDYYFCNSYNHSIKTLKNLYLLE